MRTKHRSFAVALVLASIAPALPAGAPLALAPTATWKLTAAFDTSPRSFYTHEFAPKEKSVVELLAGKNPALVTGEFGRGRVVACALTIHGKATPTAPGFWNWPDWPKVLGHAVQWAGEARPMRPEKAAGTTTLMAVCIRVAPSA